MKDLKECSHDELDQLRKELIKMSVDQLKELLNTVERDHLEVKDIVTEMSAHSAGSEDFEDKARLSSSLYSLTLKIKEQLESKKTNSLYLRTALFKKDVDVAENDLFSIKNQFTEAVTSGKNHDLRALYEKVKKAEDELEYRKVVHDTYKRFADEERDNTFY